MFFSHIFRKLALWSVLIGMALSCPITSAADDPDSSVYTADTGRTSLSGFGTLGGVYTHSRDDVGYIRTVDQSGDIGKRFSWKPDSRIGLQINHRFSTQLEFVGQAVVRNQWDNTVNKALSRAFVAYNFTPDLRVRLGRLGDSIYLMSDYQDAGYAYPWARPPNTSYTILPIHNFDGSDITYTINDGNANWRAKFLAGKIKSDIVLNGNDSNHLYLLESKKPALAAALIREQESLKVWLGYARFRLAHQNDTPFGVQAKNVLDQLSQNPFFPFADEARSLSEEIDYEGKHLGYTSVGLSYDDGTWMLQSELSRMSSDSRPFQAKQAYISLGRHFGSVMPYALIGTMRGASAISAQNNWGLLGSQTAMLQNMVIASINSALANQNNYSLGVRWDFHPKAAFKLQWDRAYIKENGWMLWRYKDMSVQNKSGKTDVISASIDFVF